MTPQQNRRLTTIVVLAIMVAWVVAVGIILANKKPVVDHQARQVEVRAPADIIAA